MDRNGGSEGIVEWIFIGLTALFTIVIFVLLSALGSYQVFAAILSGMLGAIAG